MKRPQFFVSLRYANAV